MLNIKTLIAATLMTGAAAVSFAAATPATATPPAIATAPTTTAAPAKDVKVATKPASKHIKRVKTTKAAKTIESKPAAVPAK